jgi:hypothetical protein
MKPDTSVKASFKSAVLIVCQSKEADSKKKLLMQEQNKKVDNNQPSVYTNKITARSDGFSASELKLMQ